MKYVHVCDTINIVEVGFEPFYDGRGVISYKTWHDLTTSLKFICILVLDSICIPEAKSSFLKDIQKIE